jgi:plasmid maintenance system antidote protein VapI
MKKLADTRLARALDRTKGMWTDPETGRMGMSQAELARRSGLSRMQIHNIMTKDVAITMDTAISLASVFPSSAEYIMDAILADAQRRFDAKKEEVADGSA